MRKLIKLTDGLPTVIDDQWLVNRDDHIDTATQSIANQIIPFVLYKSMFAEDQSRRNVHAVWIAPDDEFEPMAEELCKLSLIAVDFPSFRDGRGYSIGYLLRSRYGWKGELRAIGDVLRDQLNYMRRCGFNAFAVRADKNIEDAMKSFHHYTVQYQGAIDEPLPLFRRRHEA